MGRKSLHMETTQISASKTAGEIVSELVNAGATSINTEYKDGQISGLRWIMKIGGQDVLFEMPVRVEPVFKLLNGRRQWPSSYKKQDMEQAHRVAWRQLLRWIQAQICMIDTGMVQPVEVFMPYMVVNHGTGQTLFERMTESQFKMLEAPKN